VPLFFLCPCLHFYFSCHLPIHSFINLHIKQSVHLSIHPLTGESNFYSFFHFFLPLSLFLSFPLPSVFYSDIFFVRPLCSILCFSFPITPYLSLFSSSTSPLIRHVENAVKTYRDWVLKTPSTVNRGTEC
jgi:hypothetical protein